MSHAIEGTINTEVLNEESTGLLKRSMVLVYGILSYAVGVGSLLWLILAMGGLAPVGFGPLQTSSVSGAVIVNFVLVILFGMQHSVMARPEFKKWITRHLPAAIERSTYLLMTGIVTVAALVSWQTLPGTLWTVDNSIAQVVIWSAYALGWGYLFIATFITNHFELMGLRQVTLYFRNKPYTSLPFTRRYMYRYSRHPMMLGMLIGIWAVPVMSVSHFVMAGLFTLYIAIGVFLEERDLLKRFGETYRAYKKEIATLIPGMF